MKEIINLTDFINDDWDSWKLKSLTKAWEKVRVKLDEAAKHASHAAFEKNISKAPVLWDEEDWKFLSQFPVGLWSHALMWRYNQGIKEASEARENNPNKTLENVSDIGTVVLETGSKKYVFDNIYTGMRSLIEKLEKPVKYHASHHPKGVDQSNIGLQEIDPFETDVNSPKHRSKYKHGLYDFDITNPSQLNDKYIDEMSAEDLDLEPNASPEAILAAKNALKSKKNKLLKFSGFSGISQKEKASTHMSNWIKAMGLGLLGNVPDKITDPITGQEINVEQNVSPKDLSKRGKNSDGNWPAFSRTLRKNSIEPENPGIPLKVPAITRNVNYKIIDANGTIKPVSEPIRIPVLNPGKALPRITNLTPEQRDRLAKRRGEEKEDTEGKQSGGVRDLASLLSNFDILTPQQIDHLKTNQRDMHHIATSIQKLHDDRWSKENYNVGFDPARNRKGTVAIGMGEDDFKKVLDKYLPILTHRADKKIGDFLKSAGSDRDTVNDEGDTVEANTRRDKKYPPEVIKMLESIQSDLAQVCGALLALNLQSPVLGIYDPELKLTHAAKDADSYDAKVAQNSRDAFAYNFARNLTQAAFGDVPSRRRRQRHGVGATSLDAEHGSGSDGGQTTLGAGVSGSQSNRVGGAEQNWSSRRVELNPNSGSEYDPVTGRVVYNVARLGWNIPKINQSIDEVFAKESSKMNGDSNTFVSNVVDRARKRMKAVVEVTRELYEKYAQEAVAQGVPQDQIEAKAQEAVQQNLKTELEAKHPNLFQGISDQQIQRIISDQKSQLSGTVLTPELKKELEEAWENYFKAVISGQKGCVPSVTYDDEEREYLIGSELDPSGHPLSSTINNFRTFTPKDLVDVLKTQGEHFAQKYAVGFVRAVAEKNGQTMHLPDAIEAVRAAGVEPTEGHVSPPTTPSNPIVPKPKISVQAPQAPSQPPMQSTVSTTATKLTERPSVAQARDLKFVKQHKDEIEGFIKQIENSPEWKNQHTTKIYNNADISFVTYYTRALKILKQQEQQGAR